MDSAVGSQTAVDMENPAGPAHMGKMTSASLRRFPSALTSSLVEIPAEERHRPMVVGMPWFYPHNFFPPQLTAGSL